MSSPIASSRNLIPVNNSLALSCINGDDGLIERDYFDGVFEYIKQILMEDHDDLDSERAFNTCTFQDFSALQATEKYFYEALTENACNSTTGQSDYSGRKLTNRVQENDKGEERQRPKQLATSVEEPSPTEEFDKALLCHRMNPGFYNDTSLVACKRDESKLSEWELENQNFSGGPKRGRPKGSTRNSETRQVIDLTSLLTRCAQAVASFNNTTANQLLKHIREHSSPYGDLNQRLAHCFANALEARLLGTGPALYSSLSGKRILALDLVKAYRGFIKTCPFRRMSNILANKTIGRHTSSASRIHIIDFGISYGFQWPCIIQGISLRPGGPPVLRITGIDFPQSGFRPAEKIQQTGNRLKSYCQRFNVPFEYNAIAKKWDNICVEDLKIDPNETLVVNCVYRFRHVHDDGSDELGGGRGINNSPRNAVMNLIKDINPHLFVQGIVNGTYDAPFFTTRFREALYHYSSLFDMLESTMPTPLGGKDHQDRLLYEREFLGREVMNVIACEGSQRIERPQTYKQWQVRNMKAGFRQLRLHQDLMREVKVKVKRGYNRDFLLEEDHNWMLQGWKGRVLYALSFWKPM